MSLVIDPQTGLTTNLMEASMQQTIPRPLVSEFREQDPANQSFRAAGETYRRAGPKVGRNEPCPCGSAAKYKKCCMRAAA